MKINIYIVRSLMISLLFLGACKNQEVVKQELESENEKEETLVDNKYSIKYAKWFNIKYFDDYKLIELINPWDKTLYWSYKKYHGNKATVSTEKSTSLGSVSSAVVLSSTVIGMFKALGLSDKISGIGNEKYIADSLIYHKAHSGLIAQVGDMGNLNIEKIILSQASLIFNSAWGSIDKATMKLIEQAVPTAFILDWQEENPLARAEWIKFVAAFFDLEQKADSIFAKVEQDYLSLKKQINNDSKTLKVLHASPISGTWYVAGGRSYMAQLYKDAGAEYIWSEDSSTASLPLSFEAVFLKAKEADYWFTSTSEQSVKRFVEQDDRYGMFEAVKRGQVLSLKAYQDNGRPNSFWEEGNVYPNRILKDLVSIFHPELLKGHQLHFYYKLN